MQRDRFDGKDEKSKSIGSDEDENGDKEEDDIGSERIKSEIG